MKERERFELDSNVIQKARRKSYRNMILASFIVVVTSVVTSSLLAWQWNNWRLHEKMVDTELRYDVYGMNRYIGNFEEKVRPWGAEAKAPTYSLVANRPADTAMLESPFYEPRAYLEPSGTARYLQNGRKLKMWYAPSTSYEQLANERAQLLRMPETKRLELAVSLDRSYSVDEWNSRFGSLEVAYWLEDGGEAERDEPIDERTAVGVSLTDEAGKRYSSPFDQFVEDATRYVKRTKDTYVEEVLEAYKKEPRIRGVLLVGSPNELYEATASEAVRATSIGAIIDYYEEEVQ